MISSSAQTVWKYLFYISLKSFISWFLCIILVTNWWRKIYRIQLLTSRLEFRNNFILIEKDILNYELFKLIFRPTFSEIRWQCVAVTVTRLCMIGSNLQKKMINWRLPVVNLLITFLLPKIIEKRHLMFMYHFSCQYKGFLLYGFSWDLIYEEGL